MTLPAFKLEEVGFKRDQIEALNEFFGGTAATKADLIELKAELKTEFEKRFAAIESKLAIHTWLFGAVLAGIIGLYLTKVFC
jgi:hypothetical protein